MRRLVAGFLVPLVLLPTGCATLRDVPMPALVAGDKYEVTAVFDSVLGLPEQAAVKLDGALVGEVTTIRTVDYTARVGLALNEDVELPANVQAEVRFGSPMGESFVELKLPEHPTGRLGAHAVIDLPATSEAPSVGDLLAAVSTVITGGSFADMKVVITELNTALRGNQGNVRQLLRQLDGMVTRLNDHTREFDVALRSMDRLGKDLAADRALLGRSLRGFEPAIRTLSRERGQILRLMAQLRRLSRTGTATIDASRRSMLSVLDDLGPVLDTLTRNEALYQPIFAGIRDFGRATTLATWGLFLNFDLTTLINPAQLTTMVAPREGTP